MGVAGIALYLVCLNFEETFDVFYETYFTVFLVSKNEVSYRFSLLSVSNFSHAEYLVPFNEYYI